MPEVYKLKISAEADGDLESIYDYGFRKWGEQQADIYYDALLDHFLNLCDNPYLYAPIDDIRPGYRRSVCNSHSIYYRVQADTVEIMAVIGQQDFQSRL